MTDRALSARTMAIVALLGAGAAPFALSALASQSRPASRPADGTFRRGELVRVRDVKKPATLKIVGLPDEIVEANEGGVYIDDAAVTGFSREFLIRNRLGRQYIPVDHYLVMGEERLNQDISEHFGIHPSDAIELAQ